MMIETCDSDIGVLYATCILPYATASLQASSGIAPSQSGIHVPRLEWTQDFLLNQLQYMRSTKHAERHVEPHNVSASTYSSNKTVQEKHYRESHMQQVGGWKALKDLLQVLG